MMNTMESLIKSESGKCEVENYRRQLVASELISDFLAIDKIKNIVLMFLCVAMLFSNGKVDAETINVQVVKTTQESMLSGNYEKAFTQYSLSARKDNNSLAQFSLGLFNQNGWGREADVIAACQWFEKAATGGIPTSQHLTGVCFEEGVHRPEDYSAAAVWFEKAAQGGTSHEREIHPTKPIKAEDIEKSSLLKQAVEDFAKGGITLTFFREDYVRAFLIKEDHWFRATW